MLISDAEALAFDVRLKVVLEQAILTEAEPIEVDDNPASLGDEFRYDADNDLFIFNLRTRESQWMANFTYGAQILVDGLKAGEVFFALR